MEKGFESWFRNQKFDCQSLPNMDPSSGPFGLGPRATIPCFGNMVLPKASVRQEPSGWFYALPRYHQGFAPVVNSTVKEQVNPVAGPKKFLVFDQSGDQTTLIYSSGVGPVPTRYRFPSSNNPKPQSGSHPVHVNESIEESDGDDSRSEMREDTEELNALLYSSDDDDDDEMSTGHSPSAMMGFVERKRKDRSGDEEETASSGGPTKRFKQEDEGFIVNSLEDTASSGNSGINCSRDDGNRVFEEEFDLFSSGEKRLRREKMKEAINLLQYLIPGDKNGKNAMMVIDEAIHNLRNLKEKAKALGV